MKTNKKRYNVTLDVDVVKKVRKRLKPLNLKLSTFINEGLIKFLEHEK